MVHLGNYNKVKPIVQHERKAKDAVGWIHYQYQSCGDYIL